MKAKTASTDESLCPKCGGLMEGGVCGSCGHTSDNPTARSKDKAPNACPECGEPMEEDKCGKDGCGSKPKKSKDACAPKKPMADGATFHADYWGPLNDHVRRTKPMETTPDGFLEGSAAVTCVGVYRYLMPNGKVENRFRPPEEVFNEDSMDTLELATLTNGHPPTGVSPENFQQVAVGSLGEEIENDAYNVYADITIKDAKAIADVKAGRTGLSCGYSAVLVTSGEVSYPVMGYQEDPADGVYKEMEIGRQVYQVPGVWGGIPYDAIQTQIRYNHVALVDVPRGGDSLHLQFDGAESPGVLVKSTDGNPAGGHNSEQERTNMKKIHLDGQEVAYEVPEPVAAHIDGLAAKVGTLTKDHADAEAKLAAANAALEAVQKDAADVKASIPQQIADGVKAQLALVASVQELGIQVKAEDSADDIRRQVIKAAMPKVQADGLEGVGLNAHFDAACAVLAERKSNPDAAQRLSMADGIPQKPETQNDGVTWDNAHLHGGVKA